MSITYKAPAKIILSGEHSVVYTKPAFVTAVDFHLQVSLEEGTSSLQPSHIQQAIDYIQKIVVQYLNKEHISADIRPFICSIDSQIPEGRGMGSSAAFCVALVSALLHFYTGREWDKQTISTLAYQSEKHFHGMPSGVDVSASCYGGLIFYRKEFEFLKTISALNFKIPQAFEQNLILIDTGAPAESTKEMVALVGKRYNKNPQEMDHTLSSIEKVTKRMVISIVKEDWNLFIDCIDDNQKLLVKLGIVSASTSQLLEQLQPYGKGKVTGAGGIKQGSGFILFAVENKDIIGVLEKHNVSYLQFKQDFKGVCSVDH